MVAIMGLTAMFLFSYIGIKAAEDPRVVVVGCFGISMGGLALFIELIQVMKNLDCDGVAVSPGRVMSVSIGQLEDGMVLGNLI